jgi:alpha-L-fucosidase 2
MYAEAGPVIETPLSGARSLQDIVLQSWGGTVRVFPAVPKSWKDATIADMRTEGAFLVTAVKKDGQTRLIRIKSEAGEPLRVKTDMAEPIASVDGNSIELERAGEGVYEVPLQKGQTVVLSPKGSATEPPLVAPVPDQPDQRNTFGLR